MHTQSAKKFQKLFLCLAVAVVMALVPLAGGGVARAAGGIDLNTKYPGMMVKAGETVDFPLEIDNTGSNPQNVALSIVSMPDGWGGTFEGDGQIISRAYVKSGDTTSIDFNVTVPDAASEGEYQVILAVDAGNGASDTLQLDMTVGNEEIAQGTFVSQYPELQGPDTASFTFNMDLKNNSGEEQSYSLSAQAPDGWNVTFTPSSGDNQIASLSVESGHTEGLYVGIDPPANVTAGTYTIICNATSSSETLSADLNVIITGTYSMDVSTPTGMLNADAYAGSESSVDLIITNTGSADLTDVSLTASAPSSWSVRFEQSTIDKIAAGETKQVTAYVKPGSDAITGDYSLTINAANSQANASTALRVTVKTPTAWGIVGVIIIVLLIVILLYIFKKFGRR
jgi:uncharacterized membrane protein